MGPEKKPRNSHPFVQKAKPGRYAWCTCSFSEKLPFCDGNHRGTEFSPLKVEIEEEKTVAWCDCDKTCNAPWCDGAHSKD
ncbi:MAG TPA: CDGSH iron-sulfur domain-containing protein [Planctomycetota bacterium]|jgi:CDGSH-type Zn-finger protein|nr:hypothetical protein [Planctomycetota bacterium]MDP6128980.1 CDGSH iron-sulfur domain-containing protein [Planctomycetota bacterium]MDP7246477.1 CDGSH iron-sulfur domain-containing protein [Planctomycetota bacterium]MDP7560194.1 CDGSH iron-sulfur domain-containing protein [Planctomycetota bacterium]HJM40059.1 CDGSH iron-sulfur domain-containing protein [Planctomycetota bacterium]